jgi:hypothetical protein
MPSMRFTEKDVARLKALKKAKVGKNNSDLFRKGLECLCERYGTKVPA